MLPHQHSIISPYESHPVIVNMRQVTISVSKYIPPLNTNIVQYNTGNHIYCCLWRFRCHLVVQTLESPLQNSECLLHKNSCSAQGLVEPVLSISTWVQERSQQKSSAWITTVTQQKSVMLS